MAGSPASTRAAALSEALETIAEGARQVGRDPAAILLEGRVDYGSRDLDRIATHAERWRAAGASHLSVNTMAAGCASVDDHVAALAAIAEVLL